MVLISCFVAFFVMVGMVNSTSSLFIVPVCDTYGFSRAAFSVTISLCSLGSAIINIFYGKIYQRFGIRKMVGTGFIVGFRRHTGQRWPGSGFHHYYGFADKQLV